MSQWLITYTRPMAPPAAISLVLSPGLGAFLRVSGPWFGVDLPERSEIGKYKGPVPGEVNQLKTTVLAAVDEVRSNKAVPVQPGTRFLEFGVRQSDGSGEQSASFAMNKPLSPKVKKLDDAMIPIVKNLLASPYATIKGAASLREKELARKQQPELVLTLTNSGKVPVHLHNPSMGGKSDEAGVQVVIEKDRPQEQLTDEDRVYIHAKRRDLVQLKGPGTERGSAPQAVVDLGPGDALVLGVKIRQLLYLGPGQYRAFVRFFSDVEGIPETFAVEGSLQVPAGTFTVK